MNIKDQPIKFEKNTLYKVNPKKLIKILKIFS